MGDDQHGAVELVERVDQRFAAIDVQVGCRFVEDEDVRLLVGGEAHQQAHLLAARQLVDLSLAFLVAEAELGGERSYLRLAGVRQQVLDVIEHGFARAQFVELVLAEIADAKVLRCAPDALQQRQLLRDGFHQRRLALPVGADDGDAVVEIEAQADPLQHGLARGVAHVDLVKFENGGCEFIDLVELERDGAFGQRHRDDRHLLQHLHAGLRLGGL